MVMSTGMTVPRWFSVAALYCLQNSIVWTPWGPRAVPTGGAGVAEPASQLDLDHGEHSSSWGAWDSFAQA